MTVPSMTPESSTVTLTDPGLPLLLRDLARSEGALQRLATGGLTSKRADRLLVQQIAATCLAILGDAQLNGWRP